MPWMSTSEVQAGTTYLLHVLQLRIFQLENNHPTVAA